MAGQLYILVDVNIQEALRRGQTRGGRIQLPVTDILLDMLSIEEREEAASYTVPATLTTDEQKRSRSWLPASGLDATDISEALRQKRATRLEAEKRAKQTAEANRREQAERHAARVAEAKSASLDALIDSFWGQGGVRQFRPRPFFSAGIEHIKDAGRLEEVQAECDRRNAEAAQRREAAKQEELARMEREAAERKEWIFAHGSDRLKRLVEENIEHTAVYLDERLAVERPGWRWTKDVRGDEDEPRNVPESALDLLDKARASVPEDERPDVELVYWVVEACGSEHDFHEDDICPGHHDGWRGYAAKDIFMGHDVIFGGPEDE